MITEKVRFTNGLKPLAGTLYSPDTAVRGSLIFSHGLFSSKDGYKITSLAPDITGAGFVLLTFDFSFSGESGSDIENISVAREVDDLAHAAAFLDGRGFARPHLMGSSMGGAVTLLYAAARPDEVKSVITIAAPVDFRGLFLRDAGIEDPDSLPGEGMHYIDGIGLRNAFFREVAAIDTAAALKKITCPVLIIQGDMDTVVPPSNADTIAKTLPGLREKAIITGGDHNLTAPEHIASIRGLVIDWLERRA